MSVVLVKFSSASPGYITKPKLLSLQTYLLGLQLLSPTHTQHVSFPFPSL